MEKVDILRQLPGRLLPWYRQNKRDLPWRRNRQPYSVWLSEIMLQQTRVEAAKDYYDRFLEALPTVEALANCDDELLHKLWEGLGYYSRVRNLKKAARQILERHGGRFPCTYDEVIALAGIGEYTAGAICSICFDLPTPAVDGNVLRLLSRLRDDPSPIDLPSTKAEVRTALAAIYPQEAGDFTQALMELGATLCGPNRKPECHACPCREICLGYIRATAEKLPVKAPKKAKRKEDKTVLILSCDDRYALEKRPQSGLLAGLWQFPNLPGHLELGEVLEYLDERGIRVREVKRQTEKSHIFTHIRWNMRGVYLETAEPCGPFYWMTAQQVREQAALPTAFRQFWEENEYV